MDRAELEAWLRLTLSPGVGNDAARRLLAAFGLPQAIFEQPATALRQLLTPAQASALQQVPEALAAQLQATLDWLGAAEDGIARRVVTLGDAAYPTSLLATENPPCVLYVLGDLGEKNDGLNQPSAPNPRAPAAIDSEATNWPRRVIAIVGSRNPTPGGAEIARDLARDLAAAGMVVTSGLALGVDGAAHQGALAARGLTVAVAGTGLDRVYPAVHRELAHRIAAEGALVSEYPVGTPPLPEHFPRRNRVIAGLALGTLVVEAALRSGSLITARLAGEEGREVFAVPGSVRNPLARGCHVLLREGATLVESAADVLQALGGLLAHVPRGAAGEAAGSGAGAGAGLAGGGEEPLDPDHRRVLSSLGFDPVGVDTVVERSGLTADAVSSILLLLELRGLVEAHGGGRYAATARPAPE